MKSPTPAPAAQDFSPRLPADRRAILSWCLFDWANSAFPTVIMTFLFSAYFTGAVAGGQELGAALWGQANSLSALTIALIAPIMGAIADQGGRRKPWLFACSMLCVAATAGLWFIRPEASLAITALVLYGVGMIGFELAMVFYNAMLPDIVGQDRVGRISGWGWGAGYFGGLACLAASLVLFVQPDPPLFGLDAASAEQVRATFPFVALWFALFAVPIFLFTPDQPKGTMGAIAATRAGIGMLIETIRKLRAHRDAAIFLGAKMIYIDGLNTLFAFGGVYAAAQFGMSFDELLLFGIMLNVASGLGAVAFAWIDDWIGAKPTILISLSAMIVFSFGILVVDTKLAFSVLTAALSLFFGPVQSASRSMMARLAPPQSRAEFFGLFSLAGKATAFAGPMLVGWVTYAAGSERAGMATILPFFVIGAIILTFVREPSRNKQMLDG